MSKNCYEKIQKEIGPLSGRGIRIAMIDTGWDSSLNNQYVEEGVAFVGSKNDFEGHFSHDYNDRIGHGTSCIDLFHLIAPEAKVTPVRIFGEQKITSLSLLIHAMKWVVEQNFDLVNISLGTADEKAIVPLYEVCEKACENGIILVAGMHHGRLPQFPSLFDNVISVGGVKNLENPYDYYHKNGEAMEYLAKSHGHKLLSLGGKYVIRSGTSYSSPIISGFVSLLLERYHLCELDDMRSLLNHYSMN